MSDSTLISCYNVFQRCMQEGHFISFSFNSGKSCKNCIFPIYSSLPSILASKNQISLTVYMRSLKPVILAADIARNARNISEHIMSVYIACSVDIQTNSEYV